MSNNYLTESTSSIGHYSRCDRLLPMVDAKTISPRDIDLMLVTDSVTEAAQHIERHAIQRFGLTKTTRPSAWRWLGERALGASRRAG